MDAHTFTTSHVELKKKLLDAAIKKHQSVIDDFKMGIKNMLGSEGLINEDEMDLTQQEFNTEMVQRSSQLADQLAFANDEMKLLYDMTATIGTVHNAVQPGAVVITDRENFFVSASIEEFQLDGVTYFGLSKESPLYKAMEGKKKGDRFAYNFSEYIITDVF